MQVRLAIHAIKPYLADNRSSGYPCDLVSVRTLCTLHGFNYWLACEVYSHENVAKNIIVKINQLLRASQSHSTTYSRDV